MHILLTGAGGYIGSRLIDYLALHGPDMKITALYHSASPSCRPGPNLDCRVMDLSQPGFSPELPAKVDCVLHLAQSKAYRDFPAGAPDMLAVNVGGALQLLQWGMDAGASRFILASTGNVYQPADRLHLESEPVMPASMYAASKASAEFMVRQYAGFFSCHILRIFGVYGPGQTGMLIPGLARRILEDEPVTLAGGVGLRYTPLYIADCLEMIRRLILAQPREPGLEVFNLAGSETVDLSQTVGHLSRYLAREARVQVTDADPAYLMGSNQKIVDALGYAPRVDHEAGIRNYTQSL